MENMAKQYYFLSFWCTISIMKKMDYYAKHTYHNPALDYDIHWWNNYTTDYHCHTDFYEIYFAIEEGLYHVYNDNETIMKTKMLYLMPLGQFHRIYNSNVSNDATLFNLSVKPELFKRSIELHSQTLRQKTESKELITIPLEDAEYDYIRRLSEKLTYTYMLDENKRMQIVRLFLAVAAVAFDLNYRNYIDLTPAENYATDLKMRIDNLDVFDGDLSEEYKRYPIATPPLIAAFKKITGQTVVKYLVERRLRYACSLLVNTDYTVLRISMAVGYDSLSHFTNNFKAFTGFTPSEYRKSSNVPRR